MSGRKRVKADPPVGEPQKKRTKPADKDDLDDGTDVRSKALF